MKQQVKRRPWHGRAGYRAVKEKLQGAEPVTNGESNTSAGAITKPVRVPAQSETPRTTRNIMHENRETSLTCAGNKPAQRWVKAGSRNTYMNVSEESDSGVVPVKISNKGGKAPAERLEGRPGTKENARQPHTPPTQSGESVSQGLASVRQVAKERKQERFTALLHHLTINLLRESFQSIKKDAAAGVDGMSWKEYEKGMEDRLRDLHERIHRGAYRAQPSRRVYIPKADGRQSKAIGCGEPGLLDRKVSCVEGVN